MPKSPSHNENARQNPIAEALAAAHLAPHQAHKSLTLWPLLRATPSAAPPHLPLAEALAQGTLVVDEVSDSGDVPHVRVTNRGKQAVLVLFGEELLGAKQNRAMNASFLIGGESEVVLDVSCVEQNRWHRRPSACFTSSDRVVSHALRKRMNRSVSEARATGACFSSDQMEVWNEVEERLASSGTESYSAAYADYVSSRSRDLDELSKAFRAVPGQVGFVAAIGDEVEGVELVADARVFAAVFPRLLQAYAIDAADSAVVRGERQKAGAGDAPLFDSPEAFLAALARAPVQSGPSLGLGEDLRVQGRGVAGCALDAGEVVHLMAYPASETGR